MYDLKPWLLLFSSERARAQTSSTPTLYSLAVCLLFLTAQILQTISTPTQAQTLHSPLVDPPAAPTSLPEPTPSQSPAPSEEPLPEGTDIASLIAQRPAIEEYIKTIFGSKSETAIAIAAAESGTVDPDTKKFYYKTFVVRQTNYETSIGLFQINIKSKEAKVHWDRVPGNSEERKIEWLQNPANNTLLAFWIYSTSNFHPWTTYSSGKYLAFIK